MKSVNYLYPVNKLLDGSFSIPSYIKDVVVEKAKNDIFITIAVIYENDVMLLKWDEIEFLAYSTTSNTYNNRQYKNYRFLYIHFVATPDVKIDDIENLLLSKIHFSLYNSIRKYMKTSYIDTIAKPIAQLRDKVTIFPDKDDMLKCLNMDLNSIKVVILGQDPYPKGNHANGLAFGTKQGIIPASLKSIISSIPSQEESFDKTLNSWFKQGIYLLNTALSIEEGKPGSHQDIWKPLIDLVITSICIKKNPIVFILLGAKAQTYKKVILDANHIVLEAEHPAKALYEQREWQYNDIWNKTNQFLKQFNEREIKW